MKPIPYANWNGHVRTRVDAIERPRTEEDLQALIRAAAASGRRLKPIGAGHSFNAVGMNDQILVDLGRFDRIVEIDRDRWQARVQGGATLAKIISALESHELILANIGAWTEQTIEGAISTATHGTSGRYRRTLIDSVLEIRLIDGTGQGAA